MYESCTGGKEQVQAIGTRMRLAVSLGNWHVRANDSERLWPFYYSHSNNILYRSFRKEWHKQGKFNFDCHQGTDEETCDYIRFKNVSTLPDDSVPVDVMDANDGWRIAFNQPLEILETTLSPHRSFLEALMQQPDYISQYYTQIDFHTVSLKIYEHLKSPKKALIATALMEEQSHSKGPWDL